MGENAELQEEELEVLKSIYEGDSLYRYCTASKGIVLHVQVLYFMYKYCFACTGIVLYVKVLYCMYKYCSACTGIVLNVQVL